MGGLCKHKETGNRGVVLGVLKKGITTAKVQWESSGETTDVSLVQLEHVESPSFCVEKLSEIGSDVLKYIARLSGITNEIKMPQYYLNADEEKLLLPDNLFKDRKPPAFHNCSTECTTDPQICPKRVLAKTVESLSNEMVSNIMGEVIKMTSENTNNQSTEVDLNEPDEEKRKQREMKRQLMVKLLNIENQCLRLAFLQCTALKVLKLFLTTNEYSQHFLFPSVYEKEETAEKCDVIKWIMSHVVSKSIQQLKLKNIISIAEIERSESILQLNYVKCKSEEYLNKVLNSDVPKHQPQQTLQDDLKRFTPCLVRPSSSRFGMSSTFSDAPSGMYLLAK